MNNDELYMYGMDEAGYYLAMEKTRYLEELIAPSVSDDSTNTELQHAEGKRSTMNDRKV